MAAKAKTAKLTPQNLSDDAVRILVDEAVNADREERRWGEIKKQYEDQLLTVALSRRGEDGQKTDSGGFTVELEGNSGDVVAVTQAGPSMVSLDDETIQDHGELKKFYERQVKWKPFKDAMDRMKEALGGEFVRKLKAIIQRPGTIRVAYKTKTAEVKPVGK